MKVVQIYRDDTMEDIQAPDIDSLTNFSKSQGSSSFGLLYTWIYDSREFACYGWYDGECGFENKHDLPPGGNSTFLSEDSSSQLLFGDLFICQYELATKHIVDCDISDYGEFYNMCFEGFHDLMTSDEDEQVMSDSDEEVSVYKDVDDSDEEYDEDLTPSQSDTVNIELEIDTHVYQ